MNEDYGSMLAYHIIMLLASAALYTVGKKCAALCSVHCALCRVQTTVGCTYSTGGGILQEVGTFNIVRYQSAKRSNFKG